MRELFPTSSAVADPASIYDAITFPTLPDRPYVFANMVSSVDGKAQLGGSAAGLGSPTDQALMGRLRGLADGVLEGAGTVRVDRVYGALPPAVAAARQGRGQAPQPRWVVATRSGNVPLGAALFQRPEERTIVLTSALLPQARQATLAQQAAIVTMPGEPPDLLAGFRRLRQEFGIRWLLCEGGPTLLHSLALQGLVEELFLTLAPKLAGGDVKTILEGAALPSPLPRLALQSLYEHESELYLRYRVNKG